MTNFEIKNMDLDDLHVHNLCSQHRKALRDLQYQPDLVIKPADKGGNVIVMDVGAYERMCLNIIDNRQWYWPISKTLVDNFTREYYNLIFKAYQLGIIDLSTWNYLNVKYPKKPTFYSLPKVHKSLKHPPGRPIVSGCQSLTENASALVDKYLNPHVTSLFSYVKDSIDLLWNIDGKQILPNT